MRSLALALTGLLVLGALSPIVLADPDRTDAAQEKRTDRPEPKRSEHSPIREVKRVQTAIRISADGLDKDNASYDLSGLGMARCRIKENNETNRTHIHCRGTVSGKVVDENGTVLKEGRIGVVLHARQNETGEWKWFVASSGFMKRGHAQLVMRGDEVQRSGDTISFSGGEGRASFKPDDAEQRLRLQLSDGSASIERV